MASTRLYNAADAAPAPSSLDGLPVLRRWSVAPVAGVSVMGVDDLGRVHSVQITAYASDGTWARDLDGGYLRLEDPWPLPLVPGAGR